MEMEKSKVLIQFLLIFRQSGDVLFFFYARRLRGYTATRILGTLSKLDEFLLNPQVRTCSVAVQGTSGNAISENRETHGDRSSNDSYPEVGRFPHHSGQRNGPEAETNSHMVTETYPHSCILETF